MSTIVETFKIAQNHGSKKHMQAKIEIFSEY